MAPIKKFFSVNILKSITGFVIVSSLLIKQITHIIKIEKLIKIKLEKNKYLLSPSSKHINNDIRLIAYNSIP